MTESVTAKPHFGSVEAHKQKLRGWRGDTFYGCAFGIVQGLTLVTDLPAEKALEYIRNVVTAVDEVRAEPADRGLAYSRSADETYAERCPDRGPHLWGIDGRCDTCGAHQDGSDLDGETEQDDPVCPVCRSVYSKHNGLGLKLHGLAPANEYDESLDALAPCQPIGCDNGIHVPGCFYAKADS